MADTDSWCPNCRRFWHGLPKPAADLFPGCPGSHLFNDDGTPRDE